MLYFADARWWFWHRDKHDFKSFHGDKVTIENSGSAVEDESIWMLHNHGTSGLSIAPNGLMTGQNGGHQAINLAVLLGATRLLLLGYDMQPAADGRTHWFGEHPLKTDLSKFSAMLRNFDKTIQPLAEAGVEVINCTPGSALKCYPRRQLADALLETTQSLVPDPAATALSA